MLKESPVSNLLSTDRLTLEIIDTRDHDFIKMLVNTKGWLENIGERNIHTADDAIAYINKIRGTDDLVYWVARTKDTNTAVGIISFLKRNYLDHFDIGFAFLPEFHGSGYAYEATKAVLEALSALPQFEIVLATTKVTNLSSIRLLVKLGFSLEKELEMDGHKLLIYTNAAST